MIQKENNMKFESPTGQGIRSDAEGDGHHGSRRGNRKHNGIDTKGKVGQPVYAPHEGIITRESLPYHDDLKWRGVQLVHKRITSKLWYMRPLDGIIGRAVIAGQIIGTLQDIGLKYNGVTPHVHWRIVEIDPELLLKT